MLMLAMPLLSRLTKRDIYDFRKSAFFSLGNEHSVSTPLNLAMRLARRIPRHSQGKELVSCVGGVTSLTHTPTRDHRHGS